MAKERQGIKPLVKHERAYMESVIQLLDSTVQAPALSALNNYDPTSFTSEISAIKTRIAADPTYGTREAEAAISRVETYQREKFKRVLKTMSIQLHVFEGQADPIVRQAMEAALSTNVGLIKDIALEHCGTLQDYVQAGIKANPFDLHAQQKGVQGFLEGAGFDKAKNRARLITRDQNNKLVGSMNEARHRSVGGEEYRWSTSHDARVRSSHAHLDGKIFRWDSPPSEGHPGQAIQCRCVAKLIFREASEKSKPTEQISKELEKPKLQFEK